MPRFDYTLHRYNDPETGRFTAPDPLTLAPSPDHYGYMDNPLDEIDPLGLAKRKGGGGGGGNSNPAPTPTPAKRTVPTRVPPPSTLPGFAGARKAITKTTIQGGGGKRARWEDGKNIYDGTPSAEKLRSTTSRGSTWGPMTPIPARSSRGRYRDENVHDLTHHQFRHDTDASFETQAKQQSSG